MEKQWYVVNTYSGHENKVKEKLEMRAQSMDMKDYIFRVIIPEQKEVEVKDGVTKERVKKMFPGYVLVDILIEDEIVFEFDNSVEYEDFKYYMSVIDKDNILELDADVYDADETICEWLTISQKQANDKKASIGGIDIDSDSYCVFVSAKSKFDKLSELAQLIGRRIVYADEL